MKEYFDVSFAVNLKNQRKMGVIHLLPIKYLKQKQQNKKHKDST